MPIRADIAKMLAEASQEEKSTLDAVAAMQATLNSVVDMVSGLAETLGEERPDPGPRTQKSQFVPECLEKLRPAIDKLSLDETTDEKRWSEGGILLAMWVVIPGPGPQPWPSPGPLDIFASQEAKDWARNLMARTIMQTPEVASWSVMDEAERAYMTNNQTPLEEYRKMWGDLGHHDPVIRFLIRTLRGASQPWRRRLAVVLEAWVTRRAHAKALIAVQADLIEKHLDLGQALIGLKTSHDLFPAIRRWTRAHVREMERFTLDSMAREMQQALINPSVNPDRATAEDMLDKDLKLSHLPSTDWDTKVKARLGISSRKRKAPVKTEVKKESKPRKLKKEPPARKRRRVGSDKVRVIEVASSSESSDGPGSEDLEPVSEGQPESEDEGDSEGSDTEEEEDQETLIDLDAFGGPEALLDTAAYGKWERLGANTTLVRAGRSKKSALGVFLNFLEKAPLCHFYEARATCRGRYHRLDHRGLRGTCGTDNDFLTIPLALAKLLRMEPCGNCAKDVEGDLTEEEQKALDALIKLATITRDDVGQPEDNPPPNGKEEKPDPKPKAAQAQAQAVPVKEPTTVWQAMGMKSRTSITMADGKTNDEAAMKRINAAYYAMAQKLEFSEADYPGLDVPKQMPLGAAKGAEWLTRMMTTPPDDWPRTDPFDDCPCRTMWKAMYKRYTELFPSSSSKANLPRTYGSPSPSKSPSPQFSSSDEGEKEEDEDGALDAAPEVTPGGPETPGDAEETQDPKAATPAPKATPGDQTPQGGDTPGETDGPSGDPETPAAADTPAGTPK